MSAQPEDINQLLAGIIRSGHAGIATEHLARPLQKALIDQALVQGVGALCHERIAGSELARIFDNDFLLLLHTHTVAETVLDSHRRHCLCEVLTALAQAGINSLVFKGSALAMSHYPHSYLRARDDTDVLIEERHLPAVGRVLSGLGFQRALSNQQSLIQRQCLYWRRDKNGCLHNLDIHWALNNRQGLGDVLTLAYLRTRAINLPALGEQTLAPNPVDATLIACLHIAAHHQGEIRLIWLYDLYLLIEAMSPGQRQQLRLEIKRLDLAGICNIGLGLAAYYFASPGTGLDDLAPLPLSPATIRAPRRLQIWFADLAALPNSVERIRYISQHLLPTRHYMLERAGRTSSLWLPWLYLRRAARGFSHIVRR